MFLLQSQRIQILCIFTVLFIWVLTVYAEDPNVPQPVLESQDVSTALIETTDISTMVTDYERIINTSLDTNEVFEALHQLSILQIKQKDIKASKESTAALLRKFPDRPETTAVIHDIANHYFWDAGDFTESRSLYQRVIDERPDAPDTLGAYQGVACSSIILGDLAAAETATNKILTDYAGHKDVANALMRIGDAYYWNVHDNAKSRGFYQRMIRDWPEHPDTMWAYQGLACTSIALKDIPAAKAATAKLLSDYSDYEDFPGIMMRIANSYYWDAGNFKESRDLYQKVVTDWPGRPDVMGACQGLVCTSIALGDLETAKTITDKLLKDYSDQKDFPGVLMRIADSYYWNAGKHTESRALYQRMIKDWPEHPDTMWAYQGLACSSIALEDIATAKAATEKLLNDYPDYEGLPGMMMRIAYSYLWDAGQYSESRALFQQVISDWPEYSDVTGAYQGMADIAVETVHTGDPNSAMMLVDEVFEPDLEGSKEQLLEAMTRARIRVHLGNDAVAEAMVDDSIDRFEDVADVLSAQLFGYGEEYYLRAEKALKKKNIQNARADYSKAAETWNKYLNHISDSGYQCQAYYYSAVTYQHLKEYEKAMVYYKRVADQWPDYDKAWHARFMSAEFAEKLVEIGTLDAPSAAQIQEAAYQNLVQQYPDCPVIPIVRQKLSLLSQ